MKLQFKRLTGAMISVVAAMSMLASCEAEQKHDSPEKGNEIRFTADIGHFYSIKASETSFENNDEVSIAALDPINSGNVKYTVKDGVLTSDTPICWKKGQTDANRFILLYPYNPDIKDIRKETTFEFCVNADQSTHALYTASDLMLGGAEASPTDKQVVFDVYHTLSQVIINLDNKSGKTIKDAYFSGVYGKVKFEGGNITAIGEKGTIKACPIASSSSNSWVLILAPQTSKPELILTTTDGKQINYTLPEETEFKEGCKSTANIVLDEGDQVTNFTSVIDGWTPDKDLNFTTGDQTNWISIGTGKYLDDVFASLYGTTHCEMDVEMYIDANDENRIMIKNPYKNWPLSGKEFTYVSGGQIVCHLVDGQSSYGYIEKGSHTGIRTEDRGEIMIESVCPENGYSESYYFQETTDDCWSVPEDYGKSIVAYGTKGQSAPVNLSGMAILTGPGSVRFPVFKEFSGYSYNQEFGNIHITTPLDLKNVGISRLAYGVSITSELLDATLEGTAENQLYHHDALGGEAELLISANFPKTGVYCIFAAGDCTYADGEYYYGYNCYYEPYVAPGESAPVCSPEVVSCSISDLVPTTVKLVVRIPDIKNYAICPLTKSEFDALHLTDESAAFDYAYANGKSYGGSVANFVNDGQGIELSGLQTQTEYIILVAGQNMFGNGGCCKAEITTGGELSFTSLGTGTFCDNFVSSFLADKSGYEAEVEIFQESTGKPIYRVANPYKQLMQQQPELIDDAAYNQLASDYIEFFTHQYSAGNYLFFQPFYSGVSCYEDFDGDGQKDNCPLNYTQRSGDVYEDPSQYLDTFLNLEIEEGVFQIAPYVKIEGSGYAYDLRKYTQVITITLPGHEEQAKARFKTAGRPALFTRAKVEGD